MERRGGIRWGGRRKFGGGVNSVRSRRPNRCPYRMCVYACVCVHVCVCVCVCVCSYSHGSTRMHDYWLMLRFVDSPHVFSRLMLILARGTKQAILRRICAMLYVPFPRCALDASAIRVQVDAHACGVSTGPAHKTAFYTCTLNDRIVTPLGAVCARFRALSCGVLPQRTRSASTRLLCRGRVCVWRRGRR